MRNPVVPAVSKPSTCHVTVNKETATKCGAPAEHTIEGKAEIFGKLVNLKLKVCDKHMKELQKDDPRYSTSE
jgi:hypothetical protein